MRISTDWLKSADLHIYLDWISVVGIDALSIFIPNCLMSYKIITESWLSRAIRALNRPCNPRDSSRFAAKWKELMPRGDSWTRVGVPSVGSMTAEPWTWEVFGGEGMRLWIEFQRVSLWSCFRTRVVILAGSNLTTTVTTNVNFNLNNCF